MLSGARAALSCSRKQALNRTRLFGFEFAWLFIRKAADDSRRGEGGNSQILNAYAYTPGGLFVNRDVGGEELEGGINGAVCWLCFHAHTFGSRRARALVSRFED